MNDQAVAKFPEVPQNVLDGAVKLSLAVLEDPNTPRRLAQYYDAADDYVGQSFVALEPRVPERLTAADLMATSMLNIKFPASAVRRLLDDTENQQIIANLLRALPQGPLDTTTPADFQAMNALYTTVKPLLANASSKTSNRWVAASKLIARKRPDLFPVRDSVVCKYLKTWELQSNNKDWFVFRHLMRNQQIQNRLAALPAETVKAASTSQLLLDKEPLRILDAALWMYAR